MVFVTVYLLAQFSPLIAIASLSIEIDNRQSSSAIKVKSNEPIFISSFFLSEPSRLVLDVKTNGNFEPSLIPASTNGLVRNLRYGFRNDNVLRLVVELTIDPSQLTLNENTSEDAPQITFIIKKIEDGKTIRNSQKNIEKKFAVVVDAGHGGKDSGAVGPTGVLEKHITLNVSVYLANFIDSHPQMRAILSRRDDNKIRLRQRVKIARDSNADLFLSIHADAIDNQSARGSSVYVLSQSGASSELARMLAKKSNESDFIGDIKREKKDEDLWETLVDLSQRATIEESVKVAGKIIKQLRNFGPVHQPMVQYAGFMVLKALDIPSVLIETAFISNPVEEKRLSEPKAQKQIAHWIYRGVCDYFGLEHSNKSYLGDYRVTYGDTLSAIALKFGIAVKELKRVNGLSGDKIKEGELLKIPPLN